MKNMFMTEALVYLRNPSVDCEKCEIELREILEYARQFESTYIYGAGAYGKLVKRWLMEHGVNVSGFLVTSGEGMCEGLPVCSWSERLDDDIAIVVAMREAYQIELRKSGILNHYRPFYVSSAALYNLSYLVNFTKQCILAKKKIEDMENKFKEENNSLNNWHNILLIQLEDAIGDMIWSSAFLRELRRKFQEQRIDYVINEKMLPVMSNCPYVDNIMLYPYDVSIVWNIQEMEEKARQFAEKHLVNIHYDAVFCIKALPSHVTDAWENVFLALYSKAKMRLAHKFFVFPRDKIFAELWKNLFPIATLDDCAEHDVSKDLRLLSLCGAKPLKTHMELWPLQEDKEEAKKRLADRQGIFIACGIAGRQMRRNWPPERWLRLARQIGASHEERVTFVLLGGKSEIRAANIISRAGGCVLNLAGQLSLGQSIAVVQRCHIYLGSDTGILHMAAAFGLPVVELTANLQDGRDIDQGSPVRTGAWQVPSEVIYPPPPHRRTYPCHHLCLCNYTHCMGRITVRQVREALMRRIKALSNITERM